MGLGAWIVVFVAAAAGLVVAGTVLARAADEIGERTGAGGLLVGVLLAALATSLPELAGVVSAAVEGSPDLVVGAVFGSSMANMAILAVLDLVHRGRLIASVELRQARVGGAAIGLTTLAVLGIAGPHGGSLGWIGPYTVLIVVMYLVSLTWLRSPTWPEPRPADVAGGRGLRGPVLRVALAAVLVVVTAPVAVRAAQGISDTSGVSTTFAGVLLVAVATSLPEAFTSLGAVRLAAYDLAVGNLLGSNLINVALLFVADVFYTHGSLLAVVPSGEVVAGLVAIGLMALALVAIVGGGEARKGPLEPGPVLLLVVYVLGLVVVWAGGR